MLDDDDGELTKVLLSVSVSHVDGLDASNGLSVRVQFWRCGRGVEDIVSLHYWLLIFSTFDPDLNTVL